MTTENFRARFTQFCQMDHIPDITLQQMKNAKTDFIERIITGTDITD
jgi:hypothetical protein